MRLKAYDAKTQTVLASKPKMIDIKKLEAAFPNIPIRIVDSVIFIDTADSDATLKTKLDACLYDVAI